MSHLNFEEEKLLTSSISYVIKPRIGDDAYDDTIAAEAFASAMREYKNSLHNTYVKPNTVEAIARSVASFLNKRCSSDYMVHISVESARGSRYEVEARAKYRYDYIWSRFA